MPAPLRTALYAILAILMLMLMITVHELGHYLVGKIFKFKINEFSIGMGPAIFKRKMKSGEQFSIRAFPLGGFCAFEGEDDDKDDPNAFNNKKPWQRILVLIAGAFMNYVLALLIIISGKAIANDKTSIPKEMYLLRLDPFTIICMLSLAANTK